MQILIGPEHDACHIDPAAPNGYEWWYFDAFSDAGRYALVAIYFLGTPMSPYYKRVVNGHNPLPGDWCGVFFSLHEKSGERWRERAWAYNIYRDGRFSASAPLAEIGDSRMVGDDAEGGWRWALTVDEKGLWRGRARAQLEFRVRDASFSNYPSREPQTPAEHAWACIAPVCQVNGTLDLADGTTVAFHGTGYHDHNFGRLPWTDARAWYWARVHFPGRERANTAVLFHTLRDGEPEMTTRLTFHADGTFDHLITDSPIRRIGATRNAYGLRHASRCVWDGGSLTLDGRNGLFSEGPFYRRMPVIYQQGEESAVGIGEVFEPGRLCGPIASRALWTRMRRRS